MKNCRQSSRPTISPVAQHNLVVRSIVLLGCFLFLHGGNASGREVDLLELEDDAIQQAVARVAPCVVRIETLGGTERVESQFLGGGPTTGLIISPDGWIVSSAFGFLHRPASILIDLPTGERRAAKIVARDYARRLVLLRVEVDAQLPVPTFVPREELQVGQRTIAMGRTFAPEQPNISVGVLSAQQRIFGRAVQTDAKISPSNYGGPLITLDGRVIGLLVPLSPDHEQESSALAGSEWYDSGVGFAVPLDPLFRRLTDLQAGTDLLPGRLGIVLEPGYRYSVPPIVKRVIPDTPAARAGLQKADKITQVNGTSVETLAQFHTQLGQLYAKDIVQLSLLRAGQSLTLEAELLGEVPPFGQAFLGILPAPSGNTVAVELADEKRTEDKTKGSQLQGVEIRFVFPDSPAAKLGLIAGDWITHFDDEPIVTAKMLAARLEGCFPGESRRLRYLRDGKSVDAAFKSDERSGVVAANVPPRTRLQPNVSAGVPPTDNVEKSVAREIVPVTLPDTDFTCRAYLPVRWSRSDPLSLLVVLPTPGSATSEESLHLWREYSEQLGIVVLMPQPSREDRWLPAEAERIVRAVQAVAQLQQISPQRIAIYGSEGGGSMAMLVGFRAQKIIRGVAVLDAAPPVSVDLPANEPGKRISLWIAQRDDSIMNTRIDGVIQALRKRRFPVATTSAKSGEIAAEQRLSLCRWLDQLDQL
ncbi:MAG: PDZ domain-containing protein [Planctomycetota bacterium]|nr:PDZ domain-containing protein [Planctomycetota bacterium]MDA1179988.1 PDZ domain-containing protein [Planctomycetota bacterium]